MSVVAPDPVSERSPKREGAAARPVHALDERKPAWKVGVAGTVAVHVALLILFLALPKEIFESDRVSATQEADRSFEIEISPELLRPVMPVVEPLKFVEVNPAAPENAPDKTPLFGAQNQQVAQPVPTPDGVSDTPALDGEGKENATALVSGMSQEAAQPSASEILAQAFETTPPEPSAAEKERAEREQAEEAARAVNPLPGTEELVNKGQDGTGTTVPTLTPVPGAETGAEPVTGTTTGKAATGGYFSGTPAIDRARPQERPRLAAATVNARNAPTIKNDFGSKNIGAVAYNAKWSAYGEYLQRFIDAVQVQWERLILRSAFYPTSGSLVKVTFKIDATGMISQVVRVEGSGGELAQRLCVSAITERAPYGDWPEDMIAVLGKEQEITFTFFYQ
jgi:hypothetical protein